MADSPDRRGTRVIRAAVVAALLLAAPAEALEPDVDAYREARRAGVVGVVAGRVVAEPRTPRAPGVPFTGAIVTLLPRSDALVARLEQLKAGSRESSAAFTAAAPAMRKLRDAYERDLWEDGAPDLTTRVAVDAAGAFRLDEVPAGPWVLIAWHTVPVEVSGERIRSREREMFLTQPRMRGFQSVTIWLRTFTVNPGEAAILELTDRGAWFRGVIEERFLDSPR